MTHFIGFFLAVGLIQASFMLLGVEAKLYFEDVALLVVVGGTAIAAIITFPITDLARVLKAFLRIARKNPESSEVTVAQLVKLAQAAQTSQATLIAASEDKKINPFMKDGIDLILAGFTRDDIEKIMSERIIRDREREESYGGLLRTLSKYPPAFGLIGTVLGLVTLMRAVAAGADAAEIGVRMALALVATFYGLILTNFVLVPMSENLFNKSHMNMNHRELMMEGLLLIYDRKSPLVVQEMLNSYLPPLKRKDILGVKQLSKGQAA